VHAEIFDLTTIRQDVEAQGRRAGALMLDELHGRSHGVVDDVVDVELVVRGSTAAPPSVTRAGRRQPAGDQPGEVRSAAAV
jgi:hypothetical protein